ncbi:MAG: hypothetical protein ACKVS6_15290 [Planctomycetota bacterium]
MANLLMILGCVIGVIGGAAPSTVKLGPLPLDWTFTAIAAVLLISAFFMKRGKSAIGHGAETSTAKGTVGSAHIAIQRISANVKNLLGEAPILPIAELANRLDQLIKNDIQPVIDSQAAVIESQGFQQYAAHTSPWASGERLIYRAWSAATDGHRPEVINSLGESIAHFEEAARNWPGK